MEATPHTGQFIREIRKAQGLTQAQLAERVGKSVDAISQIERGVNEPSTATLRSLSYALSVPIEELVQGYVPASQPEARKALMVQAVALLSQMDDAHLLTAVELLDVLKRAAER